MGYSLLFAITLGNQRFFSNFANENKAMKKLLLLPFLFLLAACPKKQAPLLSSDETALPNTTIQDSFHPLCEISKNIIAYVDANKDVFTIIDVEKRFSKKFWEYYRTHQGKGCPVICYGDFNTDGQQDAALMIDYKGVGDRTYPDNTPFLAIFHSYETKVEKPIIIYQLDSYKDHNHSVIYEQPEGIECYIETRKRNGKDIINLILPEKSGFLIYWNEDTYRYRYINVLDEAENTLPLTTLTPEVEADLYQLLKCSHFSWREGYYQIPDYGCWSKVQKLGIANVILIPQTSVFDTHLAWQKNQEKEGFIDSLEEKIATLSIKEIKKHFCAIVFLTNPYYLDYTPYLDSSYNPTYPYYEETFLLTNGKWSKGKTYLITKDTEAKVYEQQEKYIDSLAKKYQPKITK